MRPRLSCSYRAGDQILLNRQRPEHPSPLEHGDEAPADEAARAGGENVGVVEAGDVRAGLTADCLQQIGDRAQGSRLACAVGAEQCDEFLPADVEIDTRESDDRAVVDDPQVHDI